MTPHNISPHIDLMKIRFDELEKELASPDIYAKPAECKKLTSERRRISKILELYSAWTSALEDISSNTELLESETDPEFRNLIENDLVECREKSVSLENELMSSLVPPMPKDDRNTIVEIRPAAGGDEAALFAGELFRAYLKYSEQKGWKHEVLDSTETDLGGIKEAVFSLEGEEVYSFMKFESGVHRVQRVPTTESGGRIHTSTITVSVLPEAEEVDSIELRQEDLEISTFRASGAGGQHVNRTDSAVRIVHTPTGITVASQQERSQLRNREICMRILKAKLLEMKMREEAEKHASDKRAQVGTGDRSERIRTYNFPQSRVTDHRYGISAFDLPGLMEGDLGQILDPIRESLNQEAVENLLSGLSSSGI